MADDNISKTFKILSIDGGGIKGLYSLYLLHRIEEKYCNDNETLSDYFDMICGTSTGGIIALGLSIGLNSNNLIKIYEDNAANIFPGYDGLLSRIYHNIVRFKNLLSGGKYDNATLIEIANKYFNDKKLTDSNNLLCIPSYDLSTGKNIVFKYPHKEGKLSRDKHILMKDVAIATSSAPTFFPPHYINSKECTGYHIDGGIWANNPTLVGITDALTHFVGENKEYTNYEVLSIGNINKNSSQIINSSRIKYFWNIFRFPTLIEMMMESNSQSIHYWCKTICNNTKGYYKRIESMSPSYDNIKDVTMDNTNNNFIDYMKATGQRDILEIVTKDNDKYDLAIGRFFMNKKTYVTCKDEL